MNFDALVRAAADGADDVVRSLLASRHVIPANLAHDALAAACSGGHASVVRALLADDRFTVVSNPKEMDFSPYITLAVAANSAEVVQEFCRDTHLTYPFANWRAIQALEEAIDTGRFDMVERLLAIPFEGGRSLTATSAIQSGNVRIAEMLLADQRFISHRDLLEQAAETGNIEMVRAVLNSTAASAFLRNSPDYLHKCSPDIASLILSDPRVTGDQIYELIQQAAGAGHDVSLRKLLSVRDARIGPQQLAQFQFALFKASKSGHAGAVRLLLQDDRWNPFEDDGLLKAISEAANQGHTHVISMFLEDERVVNEPEQAAITAALLMAAKHGHAQAIRRLSAALIVGPARGNILAEVSAELVKRDHVDVLRDLLADTTLTASPAALQMAAHRGSLDALRLLLRDDRVRDAGDVGIVRAAQRNDHNMLLLLLASWDNQAQQADAAQQARDAAQTWQTRQYIDELMALENRRCLDALRGLLALDPAMIDMNILWPLAQSAAAAGLDGATLQRLEREGRLMPILHQAFGSGLTKSFAPVFLENLTALTQFSNLSNAYPTLSARGSRDGQPHTVHISDEIAHVVRQMTSGISDRATDILWAYVCENNEKAAESSSFLSFLVRSRTPEETKERLLNHESNVLSRLCRECAQALTVAAQRYLPREPEPAVSESRVISFRLGQLWKPVALEQLALDRKPQVREAAQQLMDVLHRFATSALRRDKVTLDRLRADLRSHIDVIERVLAENGRTHSELATTLGAAEALSRTPARQLFADEIQASLALAQARLAEAQTRVGQGRPRGPQHTRDVDMYM